MQQAALIKRVMELTPAEIERLPPAEAQTVLALRARFDQSGAGWRP